MTIQITVQVGSPPPSISTGVTPGTIPYMQNEDKAIKGYIRSCAPCPAVWVLKDDGHAEVSQQWQYYMIAINPSMTLENIYLLLDNHLAFANRTGFATLDNPTRKDYFFNRTNFLKNPFFDKVRTCSRNVVAGVEQYSLVQALKNAGNVLQGFLATRRGSLRQVRAALVSTNVLNVATFDSRKPPPLKPGKTYPTKVSEINLDDYLYNPRYNREKFIVANIVNKAGEVVQFPRGGLYSWTNDSTPYSFLPLTSNHGFGPVLSPLENFTKLPKDTLVSPYRRN